MNQEVRQNITNLINNYGSSFVLVTSINQAEIFFSIGLNNAGNRQTHSIFYLTVPRRK